MLRCTTVPTSLEALGTVQGQASCQSNRPKPGHCCQLCATCRLEMAAQEGACISAAAGFAATAAFSWAAGVDR